MTSIILQPVSSCDLSDIVQTPVDDNGWLANDNPALFSHAFEADNNTVKVDYEVNELSLCFLQGQYYLRLLDKPIQLKNKDHIKVANQIYKVCFIAEKIAVSDEQNKALENILRQRGQRTTSDSLVSPTINSEHNILHELDINEDATSIVNHHLTHTKLAYMEQSPADILDELLASEVSGQITQSYSNMQYDKLPDKSITAKVTTRLKEIIG